MGKASILKKKIKMKEKFRIPTLLKSDKGNSLLLATASAIAATMGIYFFVSLTALSEDSKQRYLIYIRLYHGTIHSSYHQWWK